MDFDSHGLPKDSLATDYADSSRTAGLMALSGDPRMTADLLAQYVIDGDQGVRYPYEDPTGNKSSNNPKNFTRDQLMCLAAGLAKLGRQDLCLKLLRAAEARKCRAQNVEADVPGSTKKFPDGADLLSPSHMNHLRICAGVKPKLLGKVWLMTEILFDSLQDPMSEPNQLMAMCKTAGPKYVKLLKWANSLLSQAVIEYWSDREPSMSTLINENF